MRQSLEILNVFNVLNQVFLKNKNLFLKNWNFLIKRATIENVLPYKTDLSKANVTTNKMGSIKWTYRIFATKCSFFWKFNVSVRTSCK